MAITAVAGLKQAIIWILAICIRKQFGYNLLQYHQNNRTLQIPGREHSVFLWLLSKVLNRLKHYGDRGPVREGETKSTN